MGGEVPEPAAESSWEPVLGLLAPGAVLPEVRADMEGANS